MQENMIESLAKLTDLSKVGVVDAWTKHDEGHLIGIAPDGYAVHDLEKYQPEPVRVRSEVRVYAVGDLIDYVNRFKVPETSVYFDRVVLADRKPIVPFKALGMIDHYGPDKPSHTTHKVALVLNPSLPFVRWEAACLQDGIAQATLADFLEENAHDIVGIESARLHELVSDFRSKTTGSFRQKRDVTSGSIVFAYSEENQPAEDVQVPSSFDILVPIFEGEEPTRLRINFRWRSREGKLVFALVPHRWLYEINVTIADIVARITEKTAVPVYYGVIGAR